jgi:hypothetical protein
MSIAQVIQNRFGDKLEAASASSAAYCAVRRQYANRTPVADWEEDETAPTALALAALEDLDGGREPSPAFVCVVGAWLKVDEEVAERLAWALQSVPSGHLKALQSLPLVIARELACRIAHLDDASPSGVAAYCRSALQRIQDTISEAHALVWDSVWAELLEGEEPLAPALPACVLAELEWNP